MTKKIIVFCILLLSGRAIAQKDSIKTNEPESDTLSNSNNPVFSTSGGEVDNDLEQQDVSSLLMSSRDIFSQFASFQFGTGRYRMRGYTAENQIISVNGVNVNNLETGFSQWSNWGGLNDVTRYTENRVGLVASRLAFSGAGGYTNIDSRASSFRKGTRISYANANRVFSHRVIHPNYSTD